jgi:apolipoprotein D and lipocalin family protein
MGPWQRLTRRLGVLLGLGILLALGACSTAPPEGITSVTPFELARYEGKWFEVARLDHSFERGLTDVSATYQAQPDGSVRVINRGFDSKKGEWQQANGRALFTGPTNQASLKVSFFGPFYGGYHVAALDPDYRWALVVGPSRDYVWILARDRQLSAAVRQQLLDKAVQLRLPTEQLIWVSQTRDGG